MCILLSTTYLQGNVFHSPAFFCFQVSPCVIVTTQFQFNPAIKCSLVCTQARLDTLVLLYGNVVVLQTNVIQATTTLSSGAVECSSIRYAGRSSTSAYTYTNTTSVAWRQRRSLRSEGGTLGGRFDASRKQYQLQQCTVT